MEAISSVDYRIYFDKKGYDSLGLFIEKENISSVFVLTDQNTNSLCYSKFISKAGLKTNPEIIAIPAGEIHKNIKTCLSLWDTLTLKNADRHSLLINLGGGVITDIGGFVAASYKRGIDFVNVPTTLLGMVDAAVGGKTGVDLGVLKNQVGLFANPKMIINDEEYLKTLPKREINSGLAEIIKYGLTYDISLFNKVRREPKTFNDLIYKSVEIKNDVVLKDPNEKSLRKTLNFGHTLGHAIESYFLNNQNRPSLTHGEAIAIGMVCESFISHKLLGFSLEMVGQIKECVYRIYGRMNINTREFDQIFSLLKHDKKNIAGKVKFVLLNDIEDCKIDCEVSKELIVESLNFYT